MVVVIKRARSVVDGEHKRNETYPRPYEYEISKLGMGDFDRSHARVLGVLDGPSPRQDVLSVGIVDDRFVDDDEYVPW